MVALLLLLLAAAAPTVTGDFDRDGKRDTARLVSEGEGVVAIVIESRGRRHRIDTQHFANPYLEINRERGRIATACGKGYDLDCGPDEPKAVLLRGGELVYGESESSGFVVIWTGSRFRPIQLSD